MARAQSILIYLPHGNPRGVRVAEITTRIVRLIEVPRSELAHFLGMPEAKQVGVYFLVAQADVGEQAQVYIGQTGDLATRLQQHHRDANKEFWTRAFIAVSLTNSFTQTHALHLEWQAITAAQQAGRFALRNGNAGSKPYTPAPLEADCLEVHETIGILLATLGQPIFEPLLGVASKSSAQDAVSPAAAPEEALLCSGPDADGRGFYTEDGLVVTQGSMARKRIAPSAAASLTAKQAQLIAEGVLEPVSNEQLRFARDHAFPSPSAAACIVLGRSANGWLEWKTAKGQTLDGLERAAQTDT